MHHRLSRAWAIISAVSQTDRRVGRRGNGQPASLSVRPAGVEMELMDGRTTVVPMLPDLSSPTSAEDIYGTRKLYLTVHGTRYVNFIT